MSNFKKIELVHIFAVIFILLDLFISGLISSFVFFIEINIYISIFLFCILIFVISCSFAFLGIKFFNYLLNKIKYSEPTISINLKLTTPDLRYIVVDDKTNVYYWKIRNLNSITIYNLKTFDIKKVRYLFKRSRRVVKDNIRIANETRERKPHWLYDINVLICSSQKHKNELISLISSLNNYLIYELGKLYVGYIEETETLIIRTFNADEVDLVSFFRYRKGLKFICKYLNFPYREIIRSL